MIKSAVLVSSLRLSIAAEALYIGQFGQPSAELDGSFLESGCFLKSELAGHSAQEHLLAIAFS
jgi:hypothetical protein